MSGIVEHTVKEYAAKERVSERTVYNWLGKGAVEYRRTPGGGIRIMDRSQPRSRFVVFDMKSSEISRKASG